MKIRQNQQRTIQNQGKMKEKKEKKKHDKIAVMWKVAFGHGTIVEWSAGKGPKGEGNCKGQVHFSGHQFAADPNSNRACNLYKHYTGVS